MKKNTFLLITLFIATISYSQILINENFNGATIPSGWHTNATLGTGSQLWTFGSGNMPGTIGVGSADFSTNAAIFNDDAAGDSGLNDHAVLEVGPLNVSGMSNLMLTYQYALNVIPGDNTTLKVGIWDNTNSEYITLVTYDSDTDPTNAAVNIPVTLPGVDLANLYIGFLFNDGNGAWSWGAGIDNVRLGVKVANDYCQNAIAVPVNNAGTNCVNPTIASNDLASDSSVVNETPSCGNFDGGDIWYSFVAPASGEIKVIVPIVGEWSSFITAVYDSCSSNVPALDCQELFGINAPTNIPAEAIYTGLTPGFTYLLRAWDYNNDDFGEVRFCIEEFDSTTSVNDDIIEGLTLYPNPINNILNVNSQEEITKLNVYNQIGQIVKTAQPNQRNFEIDLSTLATGVYIVKLETTTKVSSKQVMKK